MDSKLKKQWTSVSASGSFQSPLTLSKATGVPISVTKSFLSAHDGYTLHKEPRRNFTRRKFIARSINHIWGGDLLDVSRYTADNDGVRFILFFIDFVSRKLYGEPVLNKRGISIVVAMTMIFDRAGTMPERICYDRGSEMYNKVETLY